MLIDKRAFTLVELLVVIAIIALLMSILMPALARTRRQAKSVICQTTLKQWGSFFAMYTDDNNSTFMGGRGGQWGSSDWWAALEPYYKDRNLLCCSEAKDPDKYPWRGEGNFGTWGPEWFPDGFYGSYGINEWVCNPPADKDIYMPKYYWRTTQVNQGFQIPLLLDSWWDQAWAEYTDSISEYPGQFEGVGTDDMPHFCIIRHRGGLNGLFMDYSVRPVHIRELWNLRWHRGYPVNTDPPVWPDWVDGIY